MPRLGLTIGLLALAYLQARLWVLPGNFRDVWEKEAALEQLHSLNAEQAQRNADDESWVRLLENDDDSIELQAREDLDLVRPGETLYLIPQ